MDLIICIRRISRHIEEKHLREFRRRFTRIYVSREIFGRNKEGIWRRR